MKESKKTNHNLVQEDKLHPGIEIISLGELKTKVQSKEIAEPVIIGNFQVKYYPGRHEEFDIIHINDDSFAGSVSCTDIIELAETLIDFGVKIIRDDLPGSPIEPTPTIQDTAGRTYECEDTNDIVWLAEGESVDFDRSSRAYSLRATTDNPKWTNPGRFTFAEVNRVYLELTGKEIETLTFEESRQAEIDDVEKNVPYVMIGGLQAVNEERVEASKAEIMENFTFDDALTREANLCEKLLCLDDETVYIYKSTWYYLVK